MLRVMTLTVIGSIKVVVIIALGLLRLLLPLYEVQLESEDVVHNRISCARECVAVLLIRSCMKDLGIVCLNPDNPKQRASNLLSSHAMWPHS